MTLKNELSIDSLGTFCCDFFQTILYWYWWSNTTEVSINHYITGEKLANALPIVSSDSENGQSELYYSINGMRLANRPSAPGMYIIVKDGKPKKVLIK